LNPFNLLGKVDNAVTVHGPSVTSVLSVVKSDLSVVFTTEDTGEHGGKKIFILTTHVNGYIMTVLSCKLRYPVNVY
jgi:hypothetical protein